jgi:hypothetical protein
VAKWCGSGSAILYNLGRDNNLYSRSIQFIISDYATWGISPQEINIPPKLRHAQVLTTVGVRDIGIGDWKTYIFLLMAKRQLFSIKGVDQQSLFNLLGSRVGGRETWVHPKAVSRYHLYEEYSTQCTPISTAQHPLHDSCQRRPRHTVKTLPPNCSLVCPRVPRPCQQTKGT